MESGGRHSCDFRIVVICVSGRLHSRIFGVRRWDGCVVGGDRWIHGVCILGIVFVIVFVVVGIIGGRGGYPWWFEQGMAVL